MASKIYICYYKDLRFPDIVCNTQFSAEDRRTAIRKGRLYVRNLNIKFLRKFCYFDSVYLLKKENGKDSD